MERVRFTITSVCGLIAALLLAGCFMHTYVGNGGRDKSPDGKCYLYLEIHGASRKAYVDKTKKTAYLSIWPTASKAEKPLFAGEHVFVGADVGNRAGRAFAWSAAFQAVPGKEAEIELTERTALDLASLDQNRSKQ